MGKATQEAALMSSNTADLKHNIQNATLYMHVQNGSAEKCEEDV
jgi:hypothetical protein